MKDFKNEPREEVEIEPTAVVFRVKTISYSLQTYTNLTFIGKITVQEMQNNLEEGLLRLCGQGVCYNLVDRTITCCCYIAQEIVSHSFGLTQAEWEAAYYRGEWVNHSEVEKFLVKVDKVLHEQHGVGFKGGYYDGYYAG